jgi:hypothetical protein
VTLNHSTRHRKIKNKNIFLRTDHENGREDGAGQADGQHDDESVERAPPHLRELQPAQDGALATGAHWPVSSNSSSMATGERAPVVMLATPGGGGEQSPRRNDEVPPSVIDVVTVGLVGSIQSRNCFHLLFRRTKSSSRSLPRKCHLAKKKVIEKNWTHNSYQIWNSILYMVSSS